LHIIQNGCILAISFPALSLIFHCTIIKERPIHGTGIDGADIRYKEYPMEKVSGEKYQMRTGIRTEESV
jgi:hypothetical protein